MQAQYEDIANAIELNPEPATENAELKAKIRAAAYRASARYLEEVGWPGAANVLYARADAIIGGVPECDDGAFGEDATVVCGHEELL